MKLKNIGARRLVAEIPRNNVINTNKISKAVPMSRGGKIMTSTAERQVHANSGSAKIIFGTVVKNR